MRFLKIGNVFMLKYLRREKYFIKFFRIKYEMRVWGGGGMNWNYVL